MGLPKRWSAVHGPTEKVLNDHERLGMDDPRLVGLLNIA
ncbi:unnamed protein product, partial [Allacma fusca]